MRRVLPKIVEQAAAAADERDVVGAIEDRSQHVAIAFETRTAERGERALILRRDEGQRAFALDVLEPQIRIIVRRGEGGTIVD